MNTQGFCYDDETGEVTFYRINKETGEPSVDNCPPCSERGTNIIKVTEPSRRYAKFPKGISTKTKKFQLLKANILAGSNPISYRMLLIPTLILFPGIVCILLIILEMYLHVNCHRKNKNLKDPMMYYRSPFHTVTSVFCGVCRDCDTASKIGQLQDKRKLHYDYLRGIAI